MLRTKERRYKLLWFEKGDGDGDVGAMMNDELCKKVVEIRTISDRVMTVVHVFEEDVLRLIGWHDPQSLRCLEEKQSLHDELKCELDMHNAGDLDICLGDFNGHIGKHVYGSYGFCGGYNIVQ